MDELLNDDVARRGVSEDAAEQNASHSPDMQRREFLKRFGVYAAGSAAGLYVLISSRTSAVAASDEV